MIDADPAAVFAALRGVGVKSAERAADEWAERRMERRLYTLLAPHGLSRHVGEVVALHGSAAADLVIEDPYSLTAISGIGFHSADRLAVANGVDPDSRSRTRAAAVHALREAENHGHTHLPRAELVAAMRELLGTEPAVSHLEDDDAIVVEDGRYYREWTWRAERWLAATLAGMAAAEPAWSKPPIEGEAPGLNWQQVDRGQERADPAAERHHRRPRHRQDAPDPRARRDGGGAAAEDPPRGADRAGRAAADRGDRGAPATTIHKALEWIPGELPRPRRGRADRGRPRDRRRGVDAVAGDLPAPRRRDRPRHPPGPDRRRRPASAGRPRQAVLRADRLRPRADRAARLRLPAGAAVDDRPRRPRDPRRRAAAARPEQRPGPDRGPGLLPPQPLERGRRSPTT